MADPTCQICGGSGTIIRRNVDGRDTVHHCPRCNNPHLVRYCHSATAAEVEARQQLAQEQLRRLRESSNQFLWAEWQKRENRELAELAARHEAEHRRQSEARIMGTDNVAPDPNSASGYRITGVDYGQQECTATAEVRIDPRNGRRYYHPVYADYLSPDWDSSTQSYDPTSELPQTQEPSTMNSSTAIFLVTDKVRAIRVAYDTDERNNNPGYLFKTFDQSIAKDDLVVVPTTTRHGFTICKVVEVDVDVDYTGGGIQYKWIAGKFDRTGYDATLEQEQDIIDKVNRAERARKRQELAAALKLDEVQLGDNPLLLGNAGASTTQQAS